VDTQPQSWARWSDLRIGDATAQYAFWETLARRQGWTVAFAETVFSEYRKFLHLTLTAPHPVAPPAPIKAAWDLHRELPEWRQLPEADEIERRLSGCEFANPSAVEQTRLLYALTYGRYPPESIWPARAKRLKRRKKPSAMVWALCAVGVVWPCGCRSLGALGPGRRRAWGAGFSNGWRASRVISNDYPRRCAVRARAIPLFDHLLSEVFY